MAKFDSDESLDLSPQDPEAVSPSTSFYSKKISDLIGGLLSDVRAISVYVSSFGF